MRSCQWLVNYVHLSIDCCDWEENGIDWQEVADDCMHYDEYLTVDEFMLAVNMLQDMGKIAISDGKWVLT